MSIHLTLLQEAANDYCDELAAAERSMRAEGELFGNVADALWQARSTYKLRLKRCRIDGLFLDSEMKAAAQQILQHERDLLVVAPPHYDFVYLLDLLFN